jgi:F-type H+-transporting ATPase subunit alpha
MIPIGRGQRELIIGDRQTGKTAIAIDAIINQKTIPTGRFAFTWPSGKNSPRWPRWCRNSRITAPWITPSWWPPPRPNPRPSNTSPPTRVRHGRRIYVGGQTRLVVYDDLSKHAAAYRQLSLLLRRPQGARRSPATCSTCTPAVGAGLQTVGQKRRRFPHRPPVIETQAGDVSAYIPTNVISITDGQIYLEAEPVLFGRSSGRERGSLRQPRGRKRPGESHETSGRKTAPGLGPVQRTGGLRPVRVGPGQSLPSPTGPGPTPGGNFETRPIRASPRPSKWR